ncbi:metallophosphoesterase [Candidatus Woesearchaeota archaeon]|jgi:uncharacterized protein|nr:metallophosphoesterase [Candidatus Woesearchaeota archaeon]
MLITKDFEIIDLALWMPNQGFLIIADLHMGFEEALTKQGILIPKFHFKDLILRLKKIIQTIKKRKSKNNINKIIINGDLKHNFGIIGEDEWRDVLKLIDFLKKECEELILIKGNHDTTLQHISRKRHLTTKPYFLFNNTLIIHGDKPIKLLIKQLVKENNTKITTTIIGHEHTAISLSTPTRTEKFKCFLYGKYQLTLLKKIDLITLPSFNLVTEGTDVIKEKLLSPILKTVNLKNFNVYIIGDQVYNFGKIKNLIKK